MPVGPPDRPTTTRIESAVKWAIFLAVAGLVVYLCLRILVPFARVIAWSVVLAVTCHPLHQRLLRATRRPALSALVTSMLVVLALVIPLLAVAGMAVYQAQALVKSLSESFQQQSGTGGWAAAAFAWLSRRSGLDANTIAAWASGHASELARSTGQYALSIAAGVADTIVSFVLIVFATFLLLRDGHRMLGTIHELLPFERSRSDAVFLRIRDAVHGSVYGVVAIALLQGSLCGGMMWLLGVPSAALWGMVTVLASPVPVVGSALSWVPASLYLLATGQWPRAIIMAAWGAVIVSGVDSFLRPKLVAGRVNLDEFAMFLAMLGGLSAFGVVGIVLGPVIFATAAAIIEALTEARPERKPTPSASPTR
jgi:predicted PurR-regulated permease PerM